MAQAWPTLQQPLHRRLRAVRISVIRANAVVADAVELVLQTVHDAALVQTVLCDEVRQGVHRFLHSSAKSQAAPTMHITPKAN